MLNFIDTFDAMYNMHICICDATKFLDTIWYIIICIIYDIICVQCAMYIIQYVLQNYNTLNVSSTARK